MAEEIKEAAVQEEKITEAEERINKSIQKLHKSEKNLRDLQRLGLYIAILLVLFWVLLRFIIGITTYKSQDMHPRVSLGDLVVYFRLENDIQAQDIVVIHKNGQDYIGRVVAKGGDTVDITDSESLKINGNIVSEPDIFYSTPRYEGFVEYPVELRADEYFVLGDHRNGAEDSRYFGPVTRDEIKGVVITIMRRNNL